MALELRNWKVIAAIAGIVAVVVVAVVLILGNAAPPDNVVAILDGEEITEEHVAQLQTRFWEWYKIRLDEDETLEEMITEKLLHREAEEGNYVPTEEQTEQEVEARLAAMGLTPDDFRALLDMDDASYAEYLRSFRRQLAIEYYLDAVIDVSDEQEEEFQQRLEELIEELKSQANIEYR